MTEFDAVVVGAGPNGLAAAVTIARAGGRVLVLEGSATVGGGTRTLELTLPGFRHDVCSAVHPLGVASPFFRELPLADYGLTWVQPDLPLAHPLDGGSSAVLERSVQTTASLLGADDSAYLRLMRPLATGWKELLDDLLGPIRLPRHPVKLIRFAPGLLSACRLAGRHFEGEPARALLAGLAAHVTLPLDWATTAAFGLMLGLLGHAVGWPFARGGSQAIAGALTSYLVKLGSVIEVGRPVLSLADLPPARAVLLDVTPRQFLTIAGDRLSDRYRRRLEGYRYGQGVFKIDYALSDPIPWTASVARRAGTVHLGGTLAEIAAAETDVWGGRAPERPYLIVTQPSLFDDTRAPPGKHVAWAYCHVPHGSGVDMTARMEAQFERFAPGFRDCVLARHTYTAQSFQAYNPNYIGGDINGGAQDWRQLFLRPVPQLNPYATPLPGVFLCSSSTPPGGGVHGMCGYHAARSALRWV